MLPPGKSKPRRRKVLVAVAIALWAYLGSYLFLSFRGRYEPAVIGANGVKYYDWAPAGFVEGYRWRSGIRNFYLPLYSLDRAFWHQPNEAHWFKYPRHVPDSVDDVWRAWHEGK